MRLSEKSGRLLCQHIRPRYQVIRDLVSPLSVLRRCELLRVSRAGYYRWLDRVGQTVVDRDAGLLERIRSLHRRWYGILGFRRMHRLLELNGIRLPQHRVRRLMNLHGLFGQPSGYRSGYRSFLRDTVGDCQKFRV